MNRASIRLRRELHKRPGTRTGRQRRDPKGWIITRIRARARRAENLRTVAAALAWLDEREPTWGLTVRTDRDEFARNLMRNLVMRHPRPFPVFIRESSDA